MILDVTGRQIAIGDRVVYTTKTEAPGLSWGIIEAIGQPKAGTWHNEVMVKICQTDHAGELLPDKKFDYDAKTQTGAWVITGKKVYSRLRCQESDRNGNDVQDGRLWIL